MRKQFLEQLRMHVDRTVYRFSHGKSARLKFYTIPLHTAIYTSHRFPERIIQHRVNPIDVSDRINLSHRINDSVKYRGSEYAACPADNVTHR